MSEAEPVSKTSTEDAPSTIAGATDNNTQETATKDVSASGSTYTGMATNAASGVAGTATTAAVGVKDSVFSMFGGGAKKEKAPEAEEDQDRSGSSKAKKAAETAEKEDAGEEVGVSCSTARLSLTMMSRSPRPDLNTWVTEVT